jgi:hypothetical protein
MTLSVPGIPASCEKFPHSSQLNFWSTESIFSLVCFRKHRLLFASVCNINTPGQWKESLGQRSYNHFNFPVKSQKCDIGREKVKEYLLNNKVSTRSMYILTQVPSMGTSTKTITVRELYSCSEMSLGTYRRFTVCYYGATTLRLPPVIASEARGRCAMA